MTITQQPTPPDGVVRPRAAWYLVVAVLWIAAAVVFGTAVATFVRVLDHGVTAIQDAQPVPVGGSGITVYSGTKPATRDCVLQNISGENIAMEGLSFDLSATIDHRTVYAVATSPDGLPSGVYRVRCFNAGGPFYYGDKLPLESLLIRIGISVVLGLVGLVLLIVLLVKRHTSKSRIRTQNLLTTQSQGASWGPGSAGGAPLQPYQPPPGYGQQPAQPYQPPPGYGQQPASPYQQSPYQQPPYQQQYPPSAEPQAPPPSYPESPGYDAPPPPPPDDQGQPR